MLKWFIRIGAAIILVLGASTEFALAQKKKLKKRTTEINFEDELVEGEFKKPELFFLLQKKQFNFNKLIRLRKNFIPEMRRTKEDVDRINTR